MKNYHLKLSMFWQFSYVLSKLTLSVMVWCIFLPVVIVKILFIFALCIEDSIHLILCYQCKQFLLLDLGIFLVNFRLLLISKVRPNTRTLTLMEWYDCFSMHLKFIKLAIL